jgi:hypothetical protein
MGAMVKKPKELLGKHRMIKFTRILGMDCP